ncbi:uncharacterized protein LOC120340792 isoform X2 [Styela clava]
MAGYLPNDNHGHNHIDMQQHHNYHGIEQLNSGIVQDQGTDRPNTLFPCDNEEDGEIQDAFGNRINSTSLPIMRPSVVIRAEDEDKVVEKEDKYKEIKRALALRLQQRRTRKVLADQGIIPPLKSPAAYFEQIQKLERARTGDFLNKKMLDRPERDLLIQKHILEDTSAHDSLVAHQKELKKAQLVDDLNEKIFFRPGVFELVEKNILPADDSVTEALKGGHVQYKKVDDFQEEDSSDAFSPEPPLSHDQGTSSFGSPPPTFAPSLSPASQILSQQTSMANTTMPSTWANHVSLSAPITVSKHESMVISSSSSSKMARSSTHTTAGHPYLYRQSSSSKSSKISPSALSQRNMRKKKEKPKFKKFKYHQYIPPDQQGKSTEPSNSMPDIDSPYSRLLEQQQLYLQLQIMNQHYPSLMNNQKPSTSNQQQTITKNFVPPPPPPPPTNIQPKVEKKRRPFTVQQLEEMKVAELKEELKARKEKVTGTKEVLVERLKRYAIPSPNPVPANQPISESITGLINATIQSTIRANTEQALAAAVSNNGAAGALLLNARTRSPPGQQKQEQVLQPPSFAIQVVTTKQDSRPVSTVPMDTQNQESHSNNMQQGQPSTFRFAPTSNGVQIFSTTQAMNVNSAVGNGNIQLQQTSATANQFQFNTVNTPQSTANSQPLQNSAVPGQRVIAPAPGIQFKVEGSSGSGQQYDFSEKIKDDLLHKQQKEIEDLRRMVELHRTQLSQIQEKERKSQQHDMTNNNTGSNAIDQQQDGMSLAEQNMKRQHISQMLQKHLQNRLNNKDPAMINGLNQQMATLIKQEPPVQLPDNVFSFTSNTMPPNVSLVPLKSADNSPTVHSQQDDAPIILSVNQPVEKRSLSESKDPPKYDQAIQMLNEEKRRLSHQSFGSQENMMGSPASGVGGDIANSDDMDDILELLVNKGEIPLTPTRQKNFPQSAVIDHRQPQHATMHYHYNQAQQQHNTHATDAAAANRRSLEHLHRAISCNELDTMQQHRRSLELPTLVPLSDASQGFHKDPNLQRRHSGDILESSYQNRHTGDILSFHVGNHTGLTPLFAENQTDFTSLLVSSAGDILMDATRGPPSNIQSRMNNPNCISPDAVTIDPILQHTNSVGKQLDESHKSHPSGFLNMNDPYTTQPFSPMDTGSSDIPRNSGMFEERIRDPHLSSSSIHDSEPSLDKCLDSVSMPSNTASYLRHYGQALAGASPQRNNLVKSSSQELLSDNTSGMDHTMQVDELGWLDLTLTSPYHAPPSPMSLQQQQRASIHSSVGSILGQESGGNPYNLSGEGLGNNEFDLIDSLELNSIGNTGIDWDGL